MIILVKQVLQIGWGIVEQQLYQDLLLFGKKSATHNLVSYFFPLKRPSSFTLFAWGKEVGLKRTRCQENCSTFSENTIETAAQVCDTWLQSPSSAKVLVAEADRSHIFWEKIINWSRTKILNLQKLKNTRAYEVQSARNVSRQNIKREMEAGRNVRKEKCWPIPPGTSSPLAVVHHVPDTRLQFGPVGVQPASPARWETRE